MSGEHGPSLDPHDEVAALIRLAGRRADVPEAVASRVRAAAHEQWRNVVRRRNRVRYVWATAALATAASAVLVIALRGFGDTTGSPAAGASPRIESVAGSAWAIAEDEPGAPPRLLRVGAEVPIGSAIETAEPGRAAVRLASGHSVRLDTGSRIRILDREVVALDRGAVYVDSRANARSGAPLRIRTPLGEVEEAGTQFEVRLGADSVRIRVREGSVVLRAADRHFTVDISNELEAYRDGTSRSREIPRHGPEWYWVAGITPMPDIEGLSARAFLDRIAREGGWTLQFADEETATLAAGTVLRGSVEGLGLEHALEAVLPTCGMVHRIEDGRLVVDRPAS